MRMLLECKQFLLYGFWLSLMFCFEYPAIAQIALYFPEADTISIVSGCTPPVIVFAVDTSRQFIDSVSISGGFNTNLFTPDTREYPHTINCVYFLVGDSARDYKYRLIFVDISSGDSYSVQPDTTFGPRPDTLLLQLYVLENEKTIDSAHYIAIVGQVPLSVRKDREATPISASISAYPNPVKGSMCITYHLPMSSPVTIVVYDILGREVRRLFRGVEPAGDHLITWDRRATPGGRVSSGVYLIALTARGVHRTMKVVVAR
jgi:FlgD Ig-like domain